MARKTVEQIREILSAHRDELRRLYHVKSLGVFGSYVRGEQNADSDVDILVEFEQPVGFFRFLEIEEYLAGLLGVPVDLVSRGALKPYIGRRILQEVQMV